MIQHCQSAFKSTMKIHKSFHYHIVEIGIQKLSTIIIFHKILKFVSHFLLTMNTNEVNKRNNQSVRKISKDALNIIPT